MREKNKTQGKEQVEKERERDIEKKRDMKIKVRELKKERKIVVSNTCVKLK